jgi:hypothetical protein
MRQALFVFGICATMLLGGCGPTTAKVSGVIKVANVALSEGTVFFTGESGVDSYASQVTAEGSYTLDDVKPGLYRVSFAPTAVDMPSADAMKMQVYTPPPVAKLSNKVTVPLPYTRLDSTPMKKTVAPGSQTIDLDLN